MRWSELQSTIALYTSGGVNQANVVISFVSMKPGTVDARLHYFFYTFMHQLDTRQEKEAFRFFDQNNGVENCTSKFELRGRLLTMTGIYAGPDGE